MPNERGEFASVENMLVDQRSAAVALQRAFAGCRIAVGGSRRSRAGQMGEYKGNSGRPVGGKRQQGGFAERSEEGERSLSYVRFVRRWFICGHVIRTPFCPSFKTRWPTRRARSASRKRWRPSPSPAGIAIPDGLRQRRTGTCRYHVTKCRRHRPARLLYRVVRRAAVRRLSCRPR